MAKLPAVVLVGLVACGGNNSTPDAKIQILDAPPDQKVWMDAPPPMFDLSCLGNSEPTATATVTVSGTVNKANVDIINQTFTFPPVEGAVVDACTGNCATPLATSTTPMAGTFSDGPVTTGGTAIDGYIRMTHTGDRSTYVYPPSPLTKDAAMVPVITFSASVIQALSFTGACTQNDGTNGLLAVVVSDCTGAAITDSANIVLSVKQGGTPVGDAPIDVGALAGAMAPQAQGLFLICNVPDTTGNTAITVGATYKTMPLLAHDINIKKATTTTTQVRPGYN